jgi:glycosyltransferase involved in cell wall biosynthesis
VSAAPAVSVYIQTYQQLAYIRNAIDGVLAQRAPFELEIVIADDCSTDGTREVLAAYRDRHPDLIRLLLPEENLGPTEIFRRATAELRGGYVAWLDGDDYWTDPEKLVRQVEALQAQPGWAGCFHDATVRQVDGGAPDRPYVSDELRGPLGFADLLRSNPVPSLSVMARGELVRNLPRWTWGGLWSDWLSLLAIAQHGDFGYLPEQMGVYRVHSAGISSGLSRAEQLEEDLYLYGLLDEVVDERYRPDLEGAVRSRRCQIAVERADVPFSGAVGVLAAPAEAPTYLNGRQIWRLETANHDLSNLDAGDRDGSLAVRLEKMRHAAGRVEPGLAHFPGGGDQTQTQEEGRLHLLAVGPSAEWLTRYSRLGRQLQGVSQTIAQDEDYVLLEVDSAVGAPAPMGALVEITDVSIQPGPDLLGAHIDRPLKEAATDAHTVEFSGWAIGDGAPVVAIELAREGKAFRRVPTGLPRPDLEQAYPANPGAATAGFGIDISLVGGPPEQTIEVRAVLKDQRRAAIGSVTARSRWREPLDGAPLVSVVIPCYGQAAYVEEAIESVLAQTYAQVEVVVVDDGSPDNAARLAGRFPWVRCVRQANSGLAAARNTGIRESEGELLVFLDADDRLLPRAVEVGVEELRARPEGAFAFGRYRRVAADGRRLENDEQPRPEADPYSVFLRYNYAGVPATGIFRRSALEEAGNFDETLPGAEDYDLGLRLSRQFSVLPHGEYVAEYRTHGGGMSRHTSAMLKMTLQALRRQRRHARRDRELRSAYREGRRFWRRYYGEPLAAQVRASFANREWGRGLRGTGALLRLHPRGLLSLTGKTAAPI